MYKMKTVQKALVQKLRCLRLWFGFYARGTGFWAHKKELSTRWQQHPCSPFTFWGFFRPRTRGPQGYMSCYLRNYRLMAICLSGHITRAHRLNPFSPNILLLRCDSTDGMPKLLFNHMFNNNNSPLQYKRRMPPPPPSKSAGVWQSGYSGFLVNILSRFFVELQGIDPQSRSCWIAGVGFFLFGPLVFDYLLSLSPHLWPVL